MGAILNADRSIINRSRTEEVVLRRNVIEKKKKSSIPAIEDNSKPNRRPSETTIEDSLIDADFTPLMYACSLGSVDIFDMLLQAGAMVNCADGQRRNALFWAVKSMNMELFNRLWEIPALRNTNPKILIEAVKSNLLPIIQKLFELKFYSRQIFDISFSKYIPFVTPSTFDYLLQKLPMSALITENSLLNIIEVSLPFPFFIFLFLKRTNSFFVKKKGWKSAPSSAFGCEQ